MIQKIISIGNLAVFKDFDWDKEVRNESGDVMDFQAINVIYGRNYSGKTTLSRILRAMETGQFSDKFESPSFTVALADGYNLLDHTATSPFINLGRRRSRALAKFWPRPQNLWVAL